MGEGGSGKSTLISSFMVTGQVFPTVATNSFSTFALVRDLGIGESGNDTHRVSRIYVDDYIGQNFSQVVDNDELRKRQRYIKATTLAIVVDLVGPNVKGEFTASEFDKARIKDQIAAYPDNVIQLLGGMTANGDNIVLFINKLDIMKSIDTKTIKKAERAYAPLMKRLDQLRGRHLHIIVGSAAKGWGVVGTHGGNIEAASLYEVVMAGSKDVSETVLMAALKGNRLYGS